MKGHLLFHYQNKRDLNISCTTGMTGWFLHSPCNTVIGTKRQNKIISLFIFYLTYTPPLPQNHRQIDAQFFQGKPEKQPLIIAFGGSGGGMLYAQESSRESREKILSMEYALLTIGYIGTENSQSETDRVSLDAIVSIVPPNMTMPFRFNRLGLFETSACQEG